MGLDDEKEYRASPIVRLELADLGRRVTLGTSASLQTINHEQHTKSDYPDEVSEDEGFLSSISDDVNRNYWRELADYTFTHRSFAPIGFAATNASGELARNVRLEITQPKDSAVDLISDDDLPEFPSNRRGILSSKFFRSSMLHQPKATPKVLEHDDRWTLLIDFGDIQPKATSWAADPVYVSASVAGIHRLPLRIYADNLSEPQESEIQLDFSREERPRLSLEDLRQVQDQYWKEKEKELDDY
jgi:hypothetical protein